MRGQHGVDGAPGELAMADLASARPAHPASLADRKWREIVMQEERLLVGSVQRVDPLLILTGAERGDHERLRLAAGEQGRAVRARQHAHLRHDRPHGFHVAAIDAPAGVQNIPTHDLRFDLLEDVGDFLDREGRVLGPFRTEMPHRPGLGRIQCAVALLLVRNRIGGAHIGLDQRQHLFLQRPAVRRLQLARLFRSLFRKPDDGIDHRLEMPVAEHHRAEHQIFGQFPGFRFDHQHRILGAGDDEIESALRHLVELRIEHILVVDEADARCADRAHEGGARERECRRGGNHRQDVRIVLEIVRKGRYDHLGLAPPAVRE